MKKLISAAVLSVTMLAAGQAFAWGNLTLTQSFYTPGANTTEIAKDLGTLGTSFNLTDQNKSLGTVDYKALAGAANASSLYMGMWIDGVITTTTATRIYDIYFMTTTNTTPVVSSSATPWGGFNSAADPVATYYTGLDTDLNGEVIASGSNANSYKVRMDASVNKGSYGTFNQLNAVGSGELALVGLANGTQEYADLYLWHAQYNKDLPAGARHSVITADTAIVRFTANGETILNPNAAPSAVPVPAAAWLLGSGLMSLVGLRRRKA